MEQSIKFFVGLDVHKDTIALAVVSRKQLAHSIRARSEACPEVVKGSERRQRRSWCDELTTNG